MVSKNCSIKIVLQVPADLLSEFDLGILGRFASRNEAIRYSMSLLLDMYGLRKVEG